MESIIEIQRQNHEEIELYQQALADILVKQSSNVSHDGLAGLAGQTGQT